MRPEIKARINALHAEIAELVRTECEHYRQQHKGMSEFMLQFGLAKIEIMELPPARFEQRKD